MDIFYYADYYALAMLVILVTAFVIRTWRQGATGKRLLGGALSYFFGSFITIGFSFHNAEILWRIIPNTPISYGTKPDYDFRFYALILLGIVMTVQGVAILKSAHSFALGEENARSLLIRHTLIVFALSIPLIPIHVFAAWLTIIGALTLPAILLIRPRKINRPSIPLR